METGLAGNPALTSQCHSEPPDLHAHCCYDNTVNNFRSSCFFKTTILPADFLSLSLYPSLARSALRPHCASHISFIWGRKSKSRSFCVTFDPFSSIRAASHSSQLVQNSNFVSTPSVKGKLAVWIIASKFPENKINFILRRLKADFCIFFNCFSQNADYIWTEHVRVWNRSTDLPTSESERRVVFRDPGNKREDSVIHWHRVDWFGKVDPTRRTSSWFSEHGTFSPAGIHSVDDPSNLCVGKNEAKNSLRIPFFLKDLNVWKTDFKWFTPDTNLLP